jgi:hypothetical protein
VDAGPASATAVVDAGLDAATTARASAATKNPAPAEATAVDAGVVAAGVVDAGAVAAVAVDAGAPAAAETSAAKSSLAADADTALQKPVRNCFREAEKIHWGPQNVVLKAKLGEKDGVGILTDGVVVEESIRDMQSHACFVKAMTSARFKLASGDSGQEKTFRFQHIPKVNH